MACTEMESFLSKFKNLQFAGYKATLTFEAEDGEAFVTLKAGLGCLPPPEYTPPGYHGHGDHGPRVYRAPAYYRRQERRKAARAAAEQEARQAEQVCEVEEVPVEVREAADDAKDDKETDKAEEKFYCVICDFTSNWENGLKVHMARKHSKIDQIDGIADSLDNMADDDYTGSKHYWAKGWLGSAYQSFLDASKVLEVCDISEEDKNIEKAKLLDARKTALGGRYSDFPPWSKF